MTQGERVKTIRNALGLTIERFSARLGVSKPSISSIENGTLPLSEKLTKSICNKFNVDYLWLTRGEGNMFADFVSETKGTLSQIDQVMSGENEFHKNCLKLIAKFTEEDLAAIKRIISYWEEIKRSPLL